MLSTQDLRNKSLKDLQTELKKARLDWLKTKMSLKMNQDKKAHVMRKNKRYVAQILTVMNEMNKAAQAPAKKAA